MAKEMLNITEENKEPGLRVMADISSFSARVNHEQAMRKRRKKFQSAPIFEEEPEITGGDNVGEEAEVEDNSATSQTPESYTYQWQLNGVDIIGQTARTILLLIGMIGGVLRCIVTATNRFGFTVRASVSIVVLA